MIRHFNYFLLQEKPTSLAMMQANSNKKPQPSAAFLPQLNDTLTVAVLQHTPSKNVIKRTHSF